MRAITLGLLALASACSSKAQSDPPQRQTPPAVRVEPKPLECAGVTPIAANDRRAGSGGAAGEDPVASRGIAAGNPGARASAQRGLDYLTGATHAWTEQHKCFGCHVQAVTMEALSVGLHHQYRVSMTDIDKVAAALELGVTAGGRTTGVAFEGQAWARYDMWVSASKTAELMKYTHELLEIQQPDGSIPDDDARLPITGGTMHTTYQAMQTWRQAYARTADDKWLAPMRKAERYLALQSSDWTGKSELYLQNLNYALLGLSAAGVGPSEASSARLQKLLLARQHADGGWGLDGDKSDALATGQTLYALRSAGLGDGEPAIDRGTKWLVANQKQDGSWRTYQTNQGGGDKAEAMWAVLGLVSMDVTSVAVNGLVDGQHVTPTMKLAIEARDNQAGGVQKVEVLLDDRPLAGACADKLAHTWSTADLSEGKHTLDIVATNSKQQVSRRHYEVYAGNVFLTDLGTRFDDRRGTTEIGVRNIALEAGRVDLAVYAVDAQGKRGERVYEKAAPATSGAMTFGWSGEGSDGKPRKSGKYIAELTFRDAKNQALHRTETVFVQASEAVAHAGWGEVEGNLSLADGNDATNTTVELVNDRGEVMQRVQSTAKGSYRFKSVEKGNYKVRVSKKGFAAKDAELKVEPAKAPSKADFQLH